MLSFLPSFLRGILSLLSLSLNTLFWVPIVLATALLKLLAPFAKIRNKISRLMDIQATAWIYCNSFFFRLFHNIEWNMKGLDSLNSKDSYLLLCNHRSWADIFVLQHTLKGRAPFMKFFLKRELIWVPVLGLAWWALDFPFMKRYSKAFLKKHPKLKGKDMEITRKFCQKFKNTPISIMNFLEGTRFNFQKHKAQASPYRHLLKPKAGGIAVALSTMGAYLSKTLDITIVYPENKPPLGFWTLLKGGVPKVIVRARSFNIPGNFVDKNYQEDKVFREEVQQWVNQLWEEKDRLIEDVLKECSALAG